MKKTSTWNVAEVFNMTNERGNAFVYVLIAVVLFAALSFILARQEDAKEASVITPDTARVMATQFVTTATQIKGALDQMVFAGTYPADFDFSQPGSFGSAPHFDKVYHPEGGGVTLPIFPSGVIATPVATNPDPGWYLGRFNNVEWTLSSTDDVVLTAYGMDRLVCEEINRIIAGDTTIPTLTVTARSVLVDAAEHSGANVDLTKTNCPGCNEQPSLCVENTAQDRYAFYNIVAAE